jgi:hypothetical protein
MIFSGKETACYLEAKPEIGFIRKPYKQRLGNTEKNK